MKLQITYLRKELNTKMSITETITFDKDDNLKTETEATNSIDENTNTK